MKKSFPVLVIITVAAFLVSMTIYSQTKTERSIPSILHTVTHANATCYGYKNCNACKNCKYCKHCAKDGGSCGVCK